MASACILKDPAEFPSGLAQFSDTNMPRYSLRSWLEFRLLWKGLARATFCFPNPPTGAAAAAAARPLRELRLTFFWQIVPRPGPCLLGACVRWHKDLVAQLHVPAPGLTLTFGRFRCVPVRLRRGGQGHSSRSERRTSASLHFIRGLTTIRCYSLLIRS